MGVTFPDIQRVLQDPSLAQLINTLPPHDQGCLIPRTVPLADEERLLNACLARGDVHGQWIVYGRHAYDPTVDVKVAQLRRLGFTRVEVYRGGVWEWMELRERHGPDWFPATGPPCWDALIPPATWI
jgi:hypothetical protein